LYEDNCNFETMSRRRPHEEDDGYGKIYSYWIVEKSLKVLHVCSWL